MKIYSQVKSTMEIEKVKIAVILIMLILACLLTYYFHGILTTGNIFTHFFYIPIVMASAWWKKKGLFVAVFLAIFLIVSHIVFRIDLATLNDYLRAVMFIAISIVVIILSEHISERERKCTFAYTQLNQIFNSAGDGMWVIDKNFNVLKANETFSVLSGEKKNKVIGKKCYDVLLSSLCKTSNCLLMRILNGEERINSDVKEKRKDGIEIPCIITATPFRCPDGKILGIIENFQDITERKASEEVLQKSEKQLRFLSSELLKAQESERKRIAQELHDGIGQIMSAIRYGIENVLNHMDKDRNNKTEALLGMKSLEAIYSLIENGIEEIRNICINLRPSILDDLGILATISWFCREFQVIYSEIRVDKNIDIREDEIPENLKTVIYRVMQEAFNNIAKHSKADHIIFTLQKKNGIIDLTIEDNGLGFNFQDAFSGTNFKRGLGLASMKERTELSGGNFSINSTTGAGIIVRASWPAV